MQRRLICGAVFSFSVAILGALLAWLIIPPIVRYMVDQNVILYEQTDQYERFVNVPQPLHFKVYIFNVTNVDRIQAGELPIVKEIGPYVFSQWRKKTVHNVTGDKQRILYTQRQTFVFNKAESGVFSEDDHIVVLNLPLTALMHVLDRGLRRGVKYFGRQLNNTLEQIPVVRTVKHLLDSLRGNRRSLLQAAEEESSASLGLLNSHIGEMFGHPKTLFMRTTPRTMLFEGFRFCINSKGLADLMCQILRDRQLNTMQVLPDKSVRFAMFKYKNETHDGFFSVHSGVADSVQVGDIKEWQNSSTLSTWKTEPNTCNRIAGTDAGNFPPHLKQEGSIQIFSSDICRTVEIFYEKPINYNGIAGLRFGTTASFLNEIGPDHRTECFCTDSVAKVPKRDNGCLLEGALDLTACHGAPIILTQPHMMGADERYRTVRGIRRTTDDNHRTFVDIEPNTGYPLRGGKRVQFNMFLREIDKITITKNLKTVLLPILWVDEGINLDDKMVQMLNDKLFNYLFLLDVLTWMLMIGGVITTIALVGWSFYQKQQSNKIYVFTT